MASISTILCAVGFVVCFNAARRGLWIGVAATLVFGYAYGILRGNLQETAAHFIFDFAALGLYLALLTRPLSPRQRFRLRPLMPWFLCLLGWPLLLLFVPIQDMLVQLAGLRGHVFFLLFLLIGAMMDSSDFRRLAKAIAILDIIALAFAIAELTFGLEHFYAQGNPVNDLVFGSADVVYGGVGHYRIPATFVNSAAYAGNMVASIPFLVGALAQERRGSRWRYLLAGAIAAATLGVFIAASRTAAVLLFVLGTLAILPGRIPNLPKSAWLAVLAGVALIIALTPRMQRFVSLEDTNMVSERIYDSVNENFLTLATEYPLGNGLGGGGTSLPYFLQDRVINRVVLENEYARIMAEQGIPGLLLWLVFIIWLVTRPGAAPSDASRKGKSLARYFCLISFATAPLGLGMLDAIPGTELLLILVGWFATPEPLRAAAMPAMHWTRARSFEMASQVR
jgi:hypothetical protein